MQHATRRANNSDRHLRLLTDTGARARTESEPGQTRVKPALAVWRLESTATRAFASELVRQLIAHYTDRGDLVLVPRRGGSEALREASRLGRRALALDPSKRQAGEAAANGGAVIALRPNERAALAIVALGAGASERRRSELSAELLARLEAGAFLVLALADARDGLGATVRACQRQGLQYWQHVVALAPAAFASKPPDGDDARERRRSTRCHRDLLVFRQPAHADALAGVAAAIAEVAA